MGLTGDLLEPRLDARQVGVLLGPGLDDLLTGVGGVVPRLAKK